MEIRKQTTYVGPLGDAHRIEIDRHILSDAERHNARVNNAVQIVAGLVAFVNALLFLRFMFTLFEAARVGFAASLYAITDPIVEPFRGIFPSGAADSAALVAMIVIALAGWAIASAVGWLYKPIDHDL